MTEALVELGLSNLLLSAAVGLLAFSIHRRGRDPRLAHLLWVFTLVAAITPPVLMLSLPAAPQVGSGDAAGASGYAGSVDPLGSWAGTWLAQRLPSLLVLAWTVGSVAVLGASTRRIARFSGLLRRSCRPAPPRVRRVAQSVGYEFGMPMVPSIHVSAARLAPMTWWSGGRVRVVLPAALCDEVDDLQLRWILAHELAHIKRRDHLVRWLEWLASVAFWWNPVVWWARRNLRRDEEDACDALVLERLQGQPRAYARTLLAVVEVMAGPASTPTLATGIDAARSLEHRFGRIVSPRRGERTPRVVTAGVVATALLLMTMGVSARGEATIPAPIPGSPTTSAAVITGAADPVGDLEATGPAAVATVDVLAAGVIRTVPVSAHIADGGSYLGTAAADLVIGTEADDRLEGRAGSDRLGGGPGRDVIDGGAGDDVIRGGAGRDTLSGGRGRDIIGGGAGADTIVGGAGDDIIRGGAGRDTVDAGAGDDVVRVWADGTPDAVDCGTGNDRAVIGSTDTTTRCETVLVRDPA